MFVDIMAPNNNALSPSLSPLVEQINSVVDYSTSMKRIEQIDQKIKRINNPSASAEQKVLLKKQINTLLQERSGLLNKLWNQTDLTKITEAYRAKEQVLNWALAQEFDVHKKGFAANTTTKTQAQMLPTYKNFYDTGKALLDVVVTGRYNKKLLTAFKNAYDQAATSDNWGKNTKILEDSELTMFQAYTDIVDIAEALKNVDTLKDKEKDTATNQITQEVNELKYGVITFSSIAIQLWDYDVSGQVELPPEYKDYMRKTGLSRLVFGSHKLNKFRKAMEDRDFIIDKQWLAVAGVQVAQAYDSVTKLLGDETKVQANIASYYNSVFGKTLTFDQIVTKNGNKAPDLQKLQQHLLWVPSQIYSIFYSWKLDPNLTATSSAVATKQASTNGQPAASSATDVQKWWVDMKLWWFSSTEIKDAHVHLAGLLTDLTNSSSDVSKIFKQALQNLGITMAIDVLDFKNGKVSVYPTMVGLTPWVALMVNVWGTGDKRLSWNLWIWVILTPGGIKYLAHAGASLDVSNHQRFDGRGERNLSAWGFVMFDKAWFASTWGNIMYFSNKPEGIENDRELFSSTMGQYLKWAYEAYTKWADATAKSTAVTDYLMELDRKQKNSTIKLSRNAAEEFTKHIAPLFNTISASKLENTDQLLNQIAERYAQLWANQQALDASKLAITWLGVWALITRVGTFVVPTIRITNRKVWFEDDASLINQQVKLAQDGTATIDLAPKQDGLEWSAATYTKTLNGLGGFSLAKDATTNRFKLWYTPTPWLKILIKKLADVSWNAGALSFHAMTPSALIEKNSQYSVWYTLVLWDDKLPTDTAGFVEYQSTTTSAELEPRAIVDASAWETVTIGSMPSGHTATIVGSDVVITDSTNAELWKFAVTGVNTTWITYDKATNSYMAWWTASTLTILSPWQNQELSTINVIGYDIDPKYQTEQYKFALLSLKPAKGKTNPVQNQINQLWTQVSKNQLSSAITTANSLINKINTNIKDATNKLPPISTNSQLLWFYESLSLTWRSYARFHDNAKNLQGTSVLDDLKSQKDKLVANLSKETWVDGSPLDKDSLNTEIATYLNSLTDTLTNKKVLTSSDVGKDDNKIGMILGTVLEGEWGFDEKLVSNSDYIKGSQMSLDNLPTLRSYFVNNMLTKRNDIVNIVALVKWVLENENMKDVSDGNIIASLRIYAETGKPLQFGDIQLTPSSTIEAHPWCINFKMSMKFDAKSSK
jgi:hypothetical protein